MRNIGKCFVLGMQLLMGNLPICHKNMILILSLNQLDFQKKKFNKIIDFQIVYHQMSYQLVAIVKISLKLISKP
jgi:hypothetical protein